MRLTLHTDFALRVLIQVALNEGELTTINDIAKSSDISKNHLMKLVNDLSQKGYLDTVRERQNAKAFNLPERCPSSDDLRLIRHFAKRGSGSSGG